MPSVNFKKQFAHLVRTGAKTTTIRARQFQPGDKLHLFTGPRYGPKERLGLGIVQSSVQIMVAWSPEQRVIFDSYRWLEPKECNELARNDGFQDFNDMALFFMNMYPKQQHFCGYLTTWTLQSTPEQ